MATDIQHFGTNGNLPDPKPIDVGSLNRVKRNRRRPTAPAVENATEVVDAPAEEVVDHEVVEQKAPKSDEDIGSKLLEKMLEGKNDEVLDDIIRFDTEDGDDEDQGDGEGGEAPDGGIPAPSAGDGESDAPNVDNDDAQFFEDETLFNVEMLFDSYQEGRKFAHEMAFDKMLDFNEAKKRYRELGRKKHKTDEEMEIWEALDELVNETKPEYFNTLKPTEENRQIAIRYLNHKFKTAVKRGKVPKWALEALLVLNIFVLPEGLKAAELMSIKSDLPDWK